MNLDENFLYRKEAVELKQLGFNEDCIAVRHRDGTLCSLIIGSGEEEETQVEGFGVIKNSECVWEYDEESMNGIQEVATPTYSQAFRWFREKHNLYHTIGDVYGDFTKWSFVIGQKNKGLVIPFRNNDIYFDTPEESELACLIKLIEIAKTNK
jgi:hypothetical protein